MVNTTNLYIVIVIFSILSKDVYCQGGQQNSWLRNLWQGWQQRQDQIPSSAGGSDIGPPLPAFSGGSDIGPPLPALPDGFEGSDIGPPLPALPGDMIPGGMDGSDFGPPLPDLPGDMTGTDGIPLIPGAVPTNDQGGGFETLGVVNPNEIRAVSDSDMNTNTGSLSGNSDLNLSSGSSNDANGNFVAESSTSSSGTDPDHHGHNHGGSAPKQCDGRGGVVKDSSGKITHVIDRHDCILLPVIDDPITGGHVFDPHTNEMIFAVDSQSLLPSNDVSPPIRQTGTSATGTVIRGTAIHRENSIPLPGNMNAIELGNSGADRTRQLPAPTKPSVTTVLKPKTKEQDRKEPTTKSIPKPKTKEHEHKEPTTTSIPKPKTKEHERKEPTTTSIPKPKSREHERKEPATTPIPKPKTKEHERKEPVSKPTPRPTIRTPEPRPKPTPRPTKRTPKPRRKATPKPTTPKPKTTKPPCPLNSRALRRLRILRSRGHEVNWPGSENCV